MNNKDYVVMEYYDMRVVGERKDVMAFCEEGMVFCEGSERDRLVDIWLDAKAGRRFCQDWRIYDDKDPYAGRRRKMTWEEFYEG